MNSRIQYGTEHGVQWEVDKTKFDPIIITVKSLTTNQKETVVYNCEYKPIFGYDVLDNANVEKILDDLIVKYANDGYSGYKK